MKILKTIVATAVIVFALTTVAMAGVQHFTQQSGKTAGAQAQPTYTVQLTAEQLAQLMNSQLKATVARSTHRARPEHRQRHAARHVERQQTDTRATHSYLSTSTSDARRSGTGGGTHNAEISRNNNYGDHSGGSGSRSGGCND